MFVIWTNLDHVVEVTSHVKTSVWMTIESQLLRASHTLARSHKHTQHFRRQTRASVTLWQKTVGHLEQYASNNNFKTEKKIKHTSSIDTNVRVSWLSDKCSRQFTKFLSDVPPQPWVESLFCLYSPTVCRSCSVVVAIPKEPASTRDQHRGLTRLHYPCVQ